MKLRKILFLGETYRADAQTWMNGLKEFGNFEIISWELQKSSNGFKNRVLRIFEYFLALHKINIIIDTQKPDMVIAERTTSYGFLASCIKNMPTAIAQQGKTDLWPANSILYPIKKLLQKKAFQKVTLIHSWGPIMTKHMKNVNVDKSKILELPKGIDLRKFHFQINDDSKIKAIVTRSLLKEYCHEIILKAFAILHSKKVDFSLTIVGDGPKLDYLQNLAKELDIDKKVIFTKKIANSEIPKLLQASNFYISMPATEGVSASLFEAMACGCYPIVSNIEGNQSWISHQINGQLVDVDNFEQLAKEILWAQDNLAFRKKIVFENRFFVEQNANYQTNMKIISNKYHQIIDENQMKQQ